MIFVDIMGGLGNQLFQYATAKSLAIDRNSDLFLNLEDYTRQDAQNVDHVEFKLNNFNVDYNNQFVESEINEYDNVKKIIEPLSSDNFAKFINFDDYSGNIYLKGYWQNENYFKHNQAIIQDDLKVITPPNTKNKKMLDEINNTNSVCISFRRGEYLDSYFLAQFGMCTEEYYRNAINFISKIVNNPTFFIFSDDTDWIEDNVNLDYPTVPVNFNGVGYEHEELRLMYSCKHFILANSSFSWWGAWLSNNKHKTVFAPTPWFNSFTKQSILCPDWIHLKCDRSDLFNKFDSKIFELINENDLKLLNINNMEKSIGKLGISLKMNDENSSLEFSKEISFKEYDSHEYIIELHLFSKTQGLIKIDYGYGRNIVLGYRKGHSIKYVHLVDIDLYKLIMNISDKSLVIENITIKSVDSNFNLNMQK